jgi:hypothetical protein
MARCTRLGSAADTMAQLQQQTASSELPLAVRIPPNGTASWIGLGVGLTWLSILALLGSFAAGSYSISMSRPWYWSALAVCALTAIGCGLRLLTRLPIIEATELGIATWVQGPYRSPFFVPWSRVRAVVLTRVSGADPRGLAGVRDAVGIELIQDEQFRVPERMAKAEVPVDGAARADLAWSNRSIGGDLRRWADLLRQMRSAYTEPTE